jgi:hypothetical protein
LAAGTWVQMRRTAAPARSRRRWLLFTTPPRQVVAFLGQAANALGGPFAGAGGLHPRDHGGPARQRLPAASRPAVTGRAGSVNHVVAQLGMRSVDPAIEASIQDNARADSGADGDVEEPPLALACSPGGLDQRGGIRVILEGDRNAELVREATY